MNEDESRTGTFLFEVQSDVMVGRLHRFLLNDVALCELEQKIYQGFEVIHEIL
jgi:hypothetical protein